MHPELPTMALVGIVSDCRLGILTSPRFDRMRAPKQTSAHIAVRTQQDHPKVELSNFRVETGRCIAIQGVATRCLTVSEVTHRYGVIRVSCYEATTMKQSSHLSASCEQLTSSYRLSTALPVAHPTIVHLLPTSLSGGLQWLSHELKF
jgi:hypothetical protein